MVVQTNYPIKFSSLMMMMIILVEVITIILNIKAVCSYHTDSKPHAGLCWNLVHTCFLTQDLLGSH